MIRADGSSEDPAREAVENALSAGDLVWLDLRGTDDDTLTLLRDVLRLHPLAVEDSCHFGQRPKLEEYDDFVFIVAYGACRTDSLGEPLTEVHCFYSERYLVTLHRDEIPPFAEVARAWQRRKNAPISRIAALHRVLDTLVDSVFPLLAEFDDRIDEVQDEIFARPTDDQLAALFDMRRWLVSVRRLITPQRDMLSSLLAGVVELPGMTPDAERYFRDLYDHLIRISDLVDSYRDLLSGSMDTYLSIVSNRLNVVMKQLTIIATVFLPLSFLTGFFGQNFGWLVARLGSFPVFIGAGIGTEVAAAVSLMILFRRRGWIQARVRRRPAKR